MNAMIVNFQFSYFFTTYFALILMATMVICGWFAATRGWEVELPNGTKERRGKIFKSWYFFWFQQKEPKKLYYQYVALYEIKKRIEAITKLPVDRHGIARLEAPNSIVKFKNEIEHHLKLNVNFDNTTKDIVTFTISSETPQYRFPEWIRDPMAGCITCHPTVYGNLIFWVFAILAKYTNLNTDVYVFLDMSLPALIATWVAYWLTLAFTCTLFWNYMPD